MMVKIIKEEKKNTGEEKEIVDKLNYLSAKNEKKMILKSDINIIWETDVINSISFDLFSFFDSAQKSYLLDADYFFDFEKNEVLESNKKRAHFIKFLFGLDNRLFFYKLMVNLNEFFFGVEQNKVDLLSCFIKELTKKDLILLCNKIAEECYGEFKNNLDIEQNSELNKKIKAIDDLFNLFESDNYYLLDFFVSFLNTKSFKIVIFYQLFKYNFFYCVTKEFVDRLSSVDWFSGWNEEQFSEEMDDENFSKCKSFIFFAKTEIEKYLNNLKYVKKKNVVKKLLFLNDCRIKYEQNEILSESQQDLSLDFFNNQNKHRVDKFGKKDREKKFKEHRFFLDKHNNSFLFKPKCRSSIGSQTCFIDCDLNLTQTDLTSSYNFDNSNFETNICDFDFRDIEKTDSDFIDDEYINTDSFNSCFDNDLKISFEDFWIEDSIDSGFDNNEAIKKSFYFENEKRCLFLSNEQNQIQTKSINQIQITEKNISYKPIVKNVFLLNFESKDVVSNSPKKKKKIIKKKVRFDENSLKREQNLFFKKSSSKKTIDSLKYKNLIQFNINSRSFCKGSFQIQTTNSKQNIVNIDIDKETPFVSVYIFWGFSLILLFFLIVKSLRKKYS